MATSLTAMRGYKLNRFLDRGKFLVNAEYRFPVVGRLGANVFCDTGTIQPTIDHWDQRYRVAVGFGLRITIPAMGPAPIALDFAFPLVQQPGDQTQVFSFFVGWMR